MTWIITRIDIVLHANYAPFNVIFYSCLETTSAAFSLRRSDNSEEKPRNTEFRRHGTICKKFKIYNTAEHNYSG